MTTDGFTRFEDVPVGAAFCILRGTITLRKLSVTTAAPIGSKVGVESCTFDREDRCVVDPTLSLTKGKLNEVYYGTDRCHGGSREQP